MKQKWEQAQLDWKEYFPGKINNRFKQFADVYRFEVYPCIAGRPRTKVKVEAPMKILDEIRAYSGIFNNAS